MPTHALIWVVPLLAWLMATGSPVGVVTISISLYTFESGFSRTSIAKVLVPADTLPVLGPTAFVATIPVPASPSEGAIGIPGSSSPEGSIHLAPSAVSVPACSPATRTLGIISFTFQG